MSNTAVRARGGSSGNPRQQAKRTLGHSPRGAAVDHGGPPPVVGGAGDSFMTLSSAPLREKPIGQPGSKSKTGGSATMPFAGWNSIYDESP